MTTRKRVPPINPVLKVAKHQAKIVRETLEGQNWLMPEGVSADEMAAQIFVKLARDPGWVVARFDDDGFRAWLSAQLRMRGVTAA